MKRDQAKRQAANAAAVAAADADDVLRQAFMLKGESQGLRTVLEKLQARYPSDPLFKPTGHKRPNGSRELAYHTIMDKGIDDARKTCPISISDSRAFLFKQRI